MSKIYKRRDFEVQLKEELSRFLNYEQNRAQRRRYSPSEINSMVTGNIHMWFHQLDESLYNRFQFDNKLIDRAMGSHVFHGTDVKSTVGEYAKHIMKSKFVSAYLAKQRLNRIGYSEKYNHKYNQSSFYDAHNKHEFSNHLDPLKVLGIFMKDLPNVVALSNRMLPRFQSPFVDQPASYRRVSIDDMGIYYSARFGYFDVRISRCNWVNDKLRSCILRIEPTNHLMGMNQKRLAYRERLFTTISTALSNISMFQNVELRTNTNQHIEISFDYNYLSDFDEPVEEKKVVEEGVCDINTLMANINDQIQQNQWELDELEDKALHKRQKIHQLEQDLKVLTSSVEIMERHTKAVETNE